MEPAEGCTEYDPSFYSGLEEIWLQASWMGILRECSRILDIRNNSLLNVTAVMGDALTNGAVSAASLDAVQNAIGMWQYSPDSGTYAPAYDSSDIFEKAQQIVEGLDENGEEIDAYEQEMAIRQLERDHPDVMKAIADMIEEQQGNYFDNLLAEYQAEQKAANKKAQQEYEELRRYENGEED
jgi:hypothetical protein